jgi:hypothetical protein
MTDEHPELDPRIDQREDGVVIEPGSEIDEDLEHTVPAAGEPEDGSGDAS